MSPDCLVCQTPTLDAFLCSACWQALAIDLQDLAGYQLNANGDRMIPLAVELEIVLSRQDRLRKVTVQVTGTADRPLPVNLSAGRVRDRLAGVLAGWVTRISLAHHYCQNTVASIVENAQWLLRHEHEVRNLHDVDELVRTVTEAIDTARRLIDNRAVRIYVGECGATVEDPEGDWFCAAALWADSSYAMTRCSVCDTSWASMDRWEQYLEKVKAERLAEVRGKQFGARRLASVLTALGHPIDESTVRKHARLGRLEAAGVDQHGRKTYRAADVLDLLAAPMSISA